MDLVLRKEIERGVRAHRGYEQVDLRMYKRHLSNALVFIAIQDTDGWLIERCGWSFMAKNNNDLCQITSAVHVNVNELVVAGFACLEAPIGHHRNLSESLWSGLMARCNELDIELSQKDGGPRTIEHCSFWVVTNLTVTDFFQEQVELSKKDTSTNRRQRLQSAPKKPGTTTQTVTVFVRNPDVVAEALFLAEGKCKDCCQDAPFKRRNDKSPYLEVHHVIPLSLGGDDTLDKVIAICPNCHRKVHFG